MINKLNRYFKDYKKKDIIIKKDIKVKLILIPDLCDDDLNVYDGIIIKKINKKQILDKLLRYKPYVTGYNIRIAILQYKDKLYFKDYRKKELYIYDNINLINSNDIILKIMNI